MFFGRVSELHKSRRRLEACRATGRPGVSRLVAQSAGRPMSDAVHRGRPVPLRDPDFLVACLVRVLKTSGDLTGDRRPARAGARVA
jgi:hypothetical protein